MTIIETTPSDSAPVDNGVNVEALLGARAAMTETPAAAQFQWRAHSEWVNGTHSRVTVEDFFGVGGAQTHVKAFNFDVDHPEIFAAQDNGVTPTEYLLVGLAGCLTAGVASVAQNRGIQLRSVKAEIKGDMDLAGILGISSEVRNGYRQIEVDFDIDADATPDQIDALVAQSRKRSAVYDALSNPTDIKVSAR